MQAFENGFSKPGACCCPWLSRDVGGFQSDGSILQVGKWILLRYVLSPPAESFFSSSSGYRNPELRSEKRLTLTSPA